MWELFVNDLPKNEPRTMFCQIVVVHDHTKDSLWYSSKLGWAPLEGQNGCSTAKSCRSVRGFRRHLRHHPELKGRTVILASRYEGCDIEARWREE